MKSLVPGLFLVFLSFTLSAQTPAAEKKLPARRTTASPKIDGILDDEVWKDAPMVTGFIENNPIPGRVESAERRTEVKVIYDDNAIYLPDQAVFQKSGLYPLRATE